MDRAQTSPWIHQGSSLGRIRCRLNALSQSTSFRIFCNCNFQLQDRDRKKRIKLGRWQTTKSQPLQAQVRTLAETVNALIDYLRPIAPPKNFHPAPSYHSGRSVSVGYSSRSRKIRSSRLALSVFCGVLAPARQALDASAVFRSYHAEAALIAGWLIESARS